ncbi:uncharacterized protein A4U43_C08F29370 [Asparagus officinalis]|nr:uncharacterized protein A4U43_C08F29370 [Asparagus officinalis]
MASRAGADAGTGQWRVVEGRRGTGRAVGGEDGGGGVGGELAVGEDEAALATEERRESRWIDDSAQKAGKTIAVIIGLMAGVALIIVFASFIRRRTRNRISSSRVVTLGSIEIFNTHEWLPTRPTIYFKCQGGNKTVLPDVKKTHFLYVFKGEESWQAKEWTSESL